MSPVLFELADEAATTAFAAALAHHLEPGLLITLTGDLAAGKTTLVRAALRALGHTGKVKSPTFTLVESYPLPGFIVHHFDLYRLSGASEVEEFGFADYLAPNAVCLVEWPERGGEALPRIDLAVRMDITGAETRRLALSAETMKGEDLLRQILAEPALVPLRCRI